MKKHHLTKIGGVACIASLVFGAQANAMDLAAASGLLADVAVISAQSSSALAAAANSGDVEAIVEAQNRADAVDSAMSEAQEAYSAMERAVAGGDEDAAAAAAEDLTAAQQKASDALNGVFPEVSSQDDAQTSEQQADAGGPGGTDDPPNIYDVPWETDGLRSNNQGMFSTAWSASSQGGALFSERDATPE